MNTGKKNRSNFRLTIAEEETGSQTDKMRGKESFEQMRGVVHIPIQRSGCPRAREERTEVSIAFEEKDGARGRKKKNQR